MNRSPFQRTINGPSKGANKIAQELNGEDVPTKRGGQWRESTIRSMLGNEKYTGDVLLQKTYTDDNFNRRINKGEKDLIFIKNNHEAIISHADFEAVKSTISQRRKEKSIKKDSEKYLNRYPFSGKIKCFECGGGFKRRIHGTKDNKYIAWCCSKHIANIEECSMLYIREDNIQQVFIIMMQKLIFAHKVILKPLLQKLKSENNSDNLLRVEEIEKEMESNVERQQILINLMTKGYLEPALFNKQSNELHLEAAELKRKRETIYRLINGGMEKTEDLGQLIKYVSKTKVFESFNEEVFDRFVEEIIVFSPTKIGFRLKCGITLKERVER